MTSANIEINEQFRRALDILEFSSSCVFITGRAGTGKSTLLEYFRNTTGKRVAVLAPTGVAALNVKGQTIHSFFKFKPDITPDKIKKIKSDKRSGIYRQLDIIIIDEISMVRADLLDCIDRFLRLNGATETKPFGGIQMVFTGDLYQLPPVVTTSEQEMFHSIYSTPYFYGANVFKAFDMEFVELDKVYRQHDNRFINLLNSIRNNSMNEKDIALLNTRYQPDFTPSQDELYIYLTTTNKMAEEINNQRLGSIDAELYSMQGIIEGNFKPAYLPTGLELQVKEDAQIMMLNNDSRGRWVNGSIGRITGISRDEVNETIINAELADSQEVEITPYTWEIYSFYSKNGSIQSEVLGKFTQYPLMLAWAVTIHKSQGKTFQNVIIDTGKGTFAHGQMYVALSRCTSLEGIILKKPFTRSQIRTDYHVMDFITQFQYKQAEKTSPLDEKLEIIKEAIRNQSPLEITYLKPNNEKSERTVMPVVVGTMGFRGRTYLGMQAFCLKRKELRSFRLDRILEIE